MFPEPEPMQDTGRQGCWERTWRRSTRTGECDGRGLPRGQGDCAGGGGDLGSRHRDSRAPGRKAKKPNEVVPEQLEYENRS